MVKNSGANVGDADLIPDPGIKPKSPASPASQVYFLPAEPSGKPISSHGFNVININHMDLYLNTYC